MKNTQIHAGLIGPVDNCRSERLLAIADVIESNDRCPRKLRWPDYHTLQRDALNDLQLDGPKTLLPLARQLAEHSQLLRAGVPMVSEPMFQNLVMPSLDRSLEATWSDNTSVDIGDEGISVSLPKPKRLSAFIVFSDQIRLQNPLLAGAFIENQLLAAMGRALDKAAIAGTGGTSQPTGILNDPDILTNERSTPASDSLEDMAEMEAAIANANGEDDESGYFWIADTGTRKTLRKTPAFTGTGDVCSDPIWSGEGPLGYKGLATVHAAANTLALAQKSALTFVDWQRLEIENLLNVDQALEGFRTMLVSGYFDFSVNDPNGICLATDPA